MRVLIVDDEPLARKRIRTLLRGASDVEVVHECGDGHAAIEAIRTHAPDLVFLDVQMPDPDGFGVVEAIGVQRMPVIVFVTAFDEHAVRAFEVHALDYLLKPFDRERFAASLARARTAVAQARGGDLEHRLRALLDAREASQSQDQGQGQGQGVDRADSRVHGQDPDLNDRSRDPVDRLIVRSTGRIAMVRVDEIDWIQAESNYVRLHVDQASYLMRETIGALEARLTPKRFRRIHRSTIVNLDRIKELQPSFRGDYIVLLRDGRRLTLSRTYRDRLPELFEQR